MRSGKSKLILAVVVTYNPNIDELLRLIKALIHQVSHIVIVDNGSAVDVKSFLINRNDTSVHFLPLNNNLGIATAQNAGIAWAREHKADYVVLFDQDSEPATDMIERLLEATESMVSQGYKVGAVGPRYMDDRQNNPPPFIRVQGFKLERCACLEPDAIVRKRSTNPSLVCLSHL
jgi:rhamnosyltransferase